MANKFSTNPMVIDSTFVPADCVFGTSRIKGCNLVWSGATTAGHRLRVKDKNGNVIWDTICPVSLEPQEFECAGWLNGIQVDIIDSGKLEISMD
jgi:hypothetical protein